MQFTTKDADNDARGYMNCAHQRHGGWWYNNCAYSNLNGEYGDSTSDNWKYVNWHYWKNDKSSLKGTVMMIREKS
jgi:hypothetical protein